jgi:4-amino-4-deoxy-L-arabinose transferase-like glycosyltransferase
MKPFPWLKATLILLFGLILWNYYNGISTVPFHPDESTQIYMSADASASPDVLAYVPGENTGDRWRYRLIDSPLSRTLMGWALSANNFPPNRVDWNWSVDWRTNRAAGAIPSLETLFTARLSVAWLFPATCLFLYLLAKKVGGKSTGFIAVMLFSTNALVLMHTRRAMAESSLLCAFTALAWLIIDFKNKPWFMALAAGLAVNTKQTAFPLAGLAGLETLLFPGDTSFRKRLFNVGILAAAILAVSWALNPAYWQYPVNAVAEGLRQRQDLTDRMRADYHTSTSLLEQAVILAAQVFIQPPAAYEILNYEEATRPTVDAYLAQPQNNLFRGMAGGAVMLILTITGWIVLWKKSKRDGEGGRLAFWIFSGITLICLIMLMFFTAAPFQRYYIILVPFFSTAQAASLLFLWNILAGLAKKRTAVSGSPS